MIEKFNLSQAKETHCYPLSSKLRDYYPAGNVTAIRRVLLHDAADYVRATKKIPCDKVCITYTTKQGKVAVLALDTPKKRFLFRQAEKEQFKGSSEKMEALKQKYGFIPRPINVLQKYVKYGFMTSQDVEHLYHNEQVDYKITDDRKEMEDAYGTMLEEKDVLIDGFNGYSCMSQEPKVGTFYYFFGAKMLLFYKKGTTEIVGRAVLWPWNDKLYFRKGYVKTAYQFAAASVVEKLNEDGTIVIDPLPSDFATTLQRMEGKTPIQIRDEIGYDCRVPYIDEDLMISEDKTKLSFCEDLECKETSTEYLLDYGKRSCEECGREVCEEDGVWVDDYFYCYECALRCGCCDDYFAPDADGEYTKCDGWVCQSCLDNKYHCCDHCDEYVYEDETRDIKDKNGDWITLCEECYNDENVKECEECGDCYISEEDSEDCCLCPDCRGCENEKDN